MPTNIEELQTRVEDTKNQIEKSKKLSSIEKTKKAKELELVISKIKDDLDALRVSATPQEIKELDKLESSYEALDGKFKLEFKNELNNLKNEVQNDVDKEKNNIDQKDGKKEDLKEDKEKSRIKTQRDKIPDGGKKALKIAAGITGGILLWKGIKSLFGGGKDKKENSEKEGFWNHGIGKGLKYAGIAVAGFFGVKWLMDYFSGKKTEIYNSQEQVNSYLDQPKQDIERYEGLGDSINDFYNKVWQKESSLGYKDENELGTISDNIEFEKGESKDSLSGIVPFCIDQDSDNIKNFLSQGDMNEYLLSKNYKELKNKLKGRSAEKLENILGPYVTKLKSFQIFGMNPGESFGEKIRSWLDSGRDTQQRQDELNFFFRQYSKVLTYMQDKKTQLEYKIAENIIKSKGYDGDEWPQDHDDQLDMISEALADKDFFDKYLKGDSLYNKFLNSNILGSYSILKKQGILTSKPSEVLDYEVLEEIDEDTDDILKIDKNNNSILDTALSEADQGLSQDTKEDLMETCDDLNDDIINESGTGTIQKHMEWLTYMLNMDESNKATFLEETGLTKLIEIYSSQIDAIKDKIKSSTATKEDIKSLKDLSVKYFAFKKELNLAMYTIGRTRSDNPDIMATSVNVLLKFINSFGKAIANKERGYIALHAVIVGGVIYIVRHPIKTGRALLRASIGTIRKGASVVSYGTRKAKLFQRGLRSNINHLDNILQKKSLLRRYILQGDININLRKNRRLIKEVFGIEADLSNKTGGEIVELIMGKEAKGFGNIIYKYRGSKNLRKMYLSGVIDSDAKINDKIFNRASSKVYSIDTDILKKIKSIDETTKTTPNLSKILKRMKTVDDLDKLDLLVSDQKFLSTITNKSKSEIKIISKNIRELPFEDLEKASIIDDILNTSVEKLTTDAKKLSSKVEGVIDSLKPKGHSNSLLELKIKKLEKFKTSLSTLDQNDIKIYNKIFDMDVNYMSKVLDIGDDLKLMDGIKVEEEMGKVLKSILSKDAKMLENTLRGVKLESRYSKLIKEIKMLSKIDIDFHMVEEAGKLFMKIVKIVSKVT